MVKTLQFWGVFNCRGEDSMGIGKVAGDTALELITQTSHPKLGHKACINAGWDTNQLIS